MSHLRRMYWIGFILTALFAIFVIPRYFAVHASYSDSYLFGYNNHVGVLLLLSSLFIAGIFSLRLNLFFEGSPRTEQVHRNSVFLWMGVNTVACGLIGWAVYGVSGFGESAYLIDRIQMLTVETRPYHNFEFAYGPVFLYGPVALTYLHLNAEQSYFSFWWIVSVAGVWMLAATINMLDYPTIHKTYIYSLLCLLAVSLLPTTGLNYTLFRFVPASYFALLVNRIQRKIGWKYQVASVLVTTMCTVALLLISPEMALSFAIGIIVYRGVLVLTDPHGTLLQGISVFISLCVGQGLAVWTANRAGEFSTLRSFSDGAYSFPILPAPHVLLLFFCCSLAALYIARQFAQGLRADNLVIVLAVSAGTLFAALGRCDPGHTSLAAFGIMLVGTLLASTMPSLWKTYRAAFFIFLILAPFLSTIANYRSLIAKIFLIHVFAGEPDEETRLDERLEQYASKRWGQPKAHMKIAALKQSSHMNQAIDLDALFASGSQTLEAPFSFTPNQFGSFHSPRLKTGYFYGLINAYDPSSVQKKINELRLDPHSDLILPVDFGERCKVIPDAERMTIRVFFLYPFTWKVRHADSVWQPLCDEIYLRYHPVEEQQHMGYQLWRATISADPIRK